MNRKTPWNNEGFEAIKDMGYNRYNPSKCRKPGGSPPKFHEPMEHHQVSTWNSSGWAVSQDPPYAIHIGRGGGGVNWFGGLRRWWSGWGVQTILYFHHYLGKWSNLTWAYFQMGCFNQQPDDGVNRLVRPYFFVNCGVADRGVPLNSRAGMSEFHVTLLGWWVTHLFLSSPSQNHGSVKWGILWRLNSSSSEDCWCWIFQKMFVHFCSCMEGTRIHHSVMRPFVGTNVQSWFHRTSRKCLRCRCPTTTERVEEHPEDDAALGAAFPSKPSKPKSLPAKKDMSTVECWKCGKKGH